MLSLVYFNSEVDKLQKTRVMCGVCLERECNVIIVCGHSLCFECSIRISQTTTRCPHCRYTPKKEQVYIINTSGNYTPVAHEWLRNLNGNVLVVGENSRGLAHLTHVLADVPGVVVENVKNLVGKPIFDTDHVVMVDNSKVPAGVSHPSGTVRVTRLHVDLSPAAASAEMK